MRRQKILIVRHGKGRGRHRRYMRAALDYQRRRRPDLFRCLVFHATGDPPPSWDGVGAVVFWLGDPLREWYPACYREATRLADQARARGLRAINAPEALSNGIKSTQARLWTEAGIPTPPVERFADFAAVRAAAERLPFPLLLRGDEHHGQRGACVFDGPDALLAAEPETGHYPCAISPLVDVRQGYRRADKPAEFAQLFHKKRLIVANGVIRTKHVFFSPHPIVSATSCTYDQPRWWHRMGMSPAPSPLQARCIEHDVAYWRQGEEHRDLMLRASNALGFDLVAIDYSSLSDGSPILWEANPFFQIPTLGEMMMPAHRHAAARVASYYDAIGDFLAGLLDEGASCAHPSRVLTPIAHQGPVPSRQS